VATAPSPSRSLFAVFAEFREVKKVRGLLGVCYNHAHEREYDHDLRAGDHLKK